METTEAGNPGRQGRQGREKRRVVVGDGTGRVGKETGPFVFATCGGNSRFRLGGDGIRKVIRKSRTEGCDPSLVSSYLCPGVGIRLYRQRGSRGDDFLIDSGNRLEGIDWSHTGIFEVSISHECDGRTGTQVRSCDKCPPRRKGHIVRNV